MANQKQLEILKQGVEFWNKWREENPAANIDLSFADLQNYTRKGANLRNSNLRYAKLKEADFSGSDFSGASLGGCILSKAILVNSNFNQAEIEKSKLNGANFKGANLRLADLFEADLFLADFTDANLNEASLVEAIAIGTKFNRSNLNKSDLREANFTNADLSDADLKGADLRGTIFHFTNFKKTSFGKTLLAHTIFADVDLTDANGLNDAIFMKPFTVDLATIINSQDKIPYNFIRGAGLPEKFINYLPSFLEKPFDYYSCFISYSHEDKKYAHRLYAALRNIGIRCWLDEHQMLPGDDIYDAVDKGIRFWDKVLLCCSKESLTSWWVDNEIDRAFKKEQQLMKERGKKVYALIPLNLDGYLFSDEWERGFKSQIHSRVAANFTGWEKDNKIFKDQFEKVVKALQTNGREEPPISML